MRRWVPAEGPDLSAEERFERIYHATYRKTLAYALRRTRNEADAHDVVAETYLVAWRRLDKLAEVKEPQAWLYAAAYGVISNLRRSQDRYQKLTVRAEALSVREPAADPAWSTERRDDYHQVVAAMARLSERDQEILRLVAYEDLDRTGVARVLGISTSLVRSRLFRARHRLEAALAVVSARRKLQSELTPDVGTPDETTSLDEVQSE